MEMPVLLVLSLKTLALKCLPCRTGPAVTLGQERLVCDPAAWWPKVCAHCGLAPPSVSNLGAIGELRRKHHLNLTFVKNESLKEKKNPWMFTNLFSILPGLWVFTVSYSSIPPNCAQLKTCFPKGNKERQKDTNSSQLPGQLSHQRSCTT